jgi:hypothetical protein
MPLSPATPFAQSQPHSYFHTPQPAPPAATAPTTPRSAGSLSSPRRRPGSAQQTARSGAAAQAYQAAFLTALQERQASEADRLTLFNRLQHLRSAEEKAARQIDSTAAQIRAVHLARERHARDAAQRKANEDWWAAERARAAQVRREEHQSRKEAFRLYKADMKQLRHSQAAAMRAEQRDLVEARAHIAAEELVKYQLVRSDLLERTRMFHERAAMKHAHEAARVLEAKALKIQMEQARRAAAEEDLARMEREERELLERARQTAELHQRTLDELASLVLVEDVQPTLRAAYTPISQLQGRVSRVASARKRRGPGGESAAANAAAASSNASAATPVAPAHVSSLSLSLPSPQLQHRIFTSSGYPSTYTTPRHGDEEEKQQQQQQQMAHSRHSTPSHSPSSSSHSVTAAATTGAHAFPPISDADQPNDEDEEQPATEGSGDDGAASATDENALAEQADQSATD